MKSAEEIFKKADERGLVKERDTYVSLAPKNAAGVPTPNGPHTLTLVSDEITKDKDGNQQYTVHVTEKGIEKVWNIKMFSINTTTGEKSLHYLVQTLKQYNEGETIIAEMKKNGSKNYVSIYQSPETVEIPTIQLDEDSEGTDEQLPPLTEPTKDIDVEEIPF